MSASYTPAKAAVVGIEALTPARETSSPAGRRNRPWLVAAVIPCFNRAQDLEKLLVDLKRQDLRDITMWCVIVDNASTTPLSSIKVPEGLDVEFHRLETNTGGSGGFNAGNARVLAGEGLSAKYPAPDFIWWVDSDARVGRRCLRELVKVMARDPKVGAVGSAMRDVATGQVWEIGGGIDKHRGTVYPKACGNPDERFLVKPDYVAACSALVRREAVEKTGLFPDNFIYYDDIDWSLQMHRKTGMKVRATTRSKAWHPPGDRRYCTWARYYISRNCFSTVNLMELGPKVRFRRAMVEIERAVAQSMMGLDELAELHLRGMTDFLDGNFEQIEPKNLLKPLGFQPYSKLPDEVRAQLAKIGPNATLWVHPLLKSKIAGLEGFRRELKNIKFEWPASRPKWKTRNLGGHLKSDSMAAMWRAVTGPTADVAIVPTGWPSAWFRGKVMIQITSEGFLVREVKPMDAIKKAVSVVRRGWKLAKRIEKEGDYIAPLVPAPQRKTAAPQRAPEMVGAGA